MEENNERRSPLRHRFGDRFIGLVERLAKRENSLQRSLEGRVAKMKSKSRQRAKKSLQRSVAEGQATVESLEQARGALVAKVESLKRVAKLMESRQRSIEEGEAKMQSLEQARGERVAKLEESLQRALDPSMPKVLKYHIENTEEVKQPRQIFIVRHAERVDRAFNSWHSNCFNEAGQYIGKDLNLPKSLPYRKSGPQGFRKDTPITNVGLLQAFLIGEALKEAGITIRHTFCSPSLRCVQTCHGILSGLNTEKTQAIAIEPGLFEWLHHSSFPDWMSTEDLETAGYNIASNYQPLIQKEELPHCQKSVEEYYKRGFHVSQGIIKNTADIGGNILLVGHASTLDVCSRQLMGSRTPQTYEEIDYISWKVPYCGMIMISETSNHTWEFHDLPFLQISNFGTYFDKKCFKLP